MPSKEKIKEKAKKDLYFFAKHILGYKDIVPHAHEELCYILTDTAKKKKLILMPRGSFKSSLSTVSFPIWKLINDPNERILIATETYQNAKRYLFEVKTHLENNKKLKALFGDLRPSKAGRTTDSTWSESEIVIKRNKILKEASLSCSGVDQVKVGLHMSLILVDDCVSNQSINTVEQIEKTLKFFQYLLSILEPDGTIVVIGTRYSSRDLYATIIEQFSNEFDIHIKKAFNDDGTLFFPERLTKEFLESQRKLQGSYVYNAQYMNCTIDEENAVFMLDRCKWWGHTGEAKESTLPDNLIYFMSIDPAIGTHARADYTAFVVVGVDHVGYRYIMEAFRMRGQPSEIINKLFYFSHKYPLQSVGIESVNFQKALLHAVNEEMNKRNYHIPIVEIKPDSRLSKEKRIMRIQPLFEQGMYYLRRDFQELLIELEQFPTGKHDDLIDALSNIEEILYFSDNKVRFNDPNRDLTHEEKMEKLAQIKDPLVRREWELVELELSGRRRKVKETIDL